MEIFVITRNKTHLGTLIGASKTPQVFEACNIDQAKDVKYLPPDTIKEALKPFCKRCFKNG